MQHSPVYRTIRFFALSVGFVLFVVLALRAGAQASDPRYVKGRPLLVLKSPASALSKPVQYSSSTSRYAVATVATSVTPEPTQEASSSTVTGSAAAPRSEQDSPVRTNKPMPPGQAKKAALSEKPAAKQLKD